jgi:hypothetical protein
MSVCGPDEAKRLADALTDATHRLAAAEASLEQALGDATLLTEV